MKMNNSAQQKSRNVFGGLYLDAMKNLKHSAPFDWSAEIDDGRMLPGLNVGAPGPETWLQVDLKFAGAAPRIFCWVE